MKITKDFAPPPPAFRPFTMTLHVDTPEQYEGLLTLSCTSHCIGNAMHGEGPESITAAAGIIEALYAALPTGTEVGL